MIDPETDQINPEIEQVDPFEDWIDIGGESGGALWPNTNF